MNSINRRRFCRVITASGVLPAFGVGFSSPSQAVGIKNAYPSMIGGLQRYTTTYEDSLVDLARKYGLGYTEIVSANPGVDPWVPGKSKNILLPTAHILPDGPREGILINLADQRLYFFREDGRTVDSAPLGIGNTGWDTPKGRTNVVRKKKNPTWYVPQSVREDQPELPAIVRPGPDNPLGSYAVYLGWPGYLFHGTNKPFGVGRRVSHGCVRTFVLGHERCNQGDVRGGAHSNGLTLEEKQAVADCVKEAIQAGAVGFSTNRFSGAKFILTEIKGEI